MRFETRMKMTGMLIVMAGLFAAVPARAGGHQLIYDFFSPYLQRYDGVMPGAGDDLAVNTATQMIDPWPPYVGDRHIPGDGERMSNAVRRYHDVSKLPCAPLPLAPVQIEATGLAGGAVALAVANAGGADCSSTSGVSTTNSGGSGNGGPLTLTAPPR
jgi:hypothetical protein